MRIVIIGAGISGLIAYRYFSDRGFDAEVIEAESYQGSLEKHSAIFRTRTRSVSDILHCDIEEVKVEKGYIDDKKLFCHEPTIRMKNQYSVKVSGEMRERSIYKDRTDDERFILKNISSIPASDISDATEVKEISDGCMKTSTFPDGHPSFDFDYDFCISTIPINNLLGICGENFEKIKFDKKTIYVRRYNLSIVSDAFQTIYFTDPRMSVYRATVQRKELIIESMAVNPYSTNPEDAEIFEAFGIKKDMLENEQPDNFIMPYGKILPIDDNYRRGLIMMLSEKYNIFSLGRHAIWKNNVGADEVAEDIKKIHRMISVSDEVRKYEGRLGK